MLKGVLHEQGIRHRSAQQDRERRRPARVRFDHGCGSAFRHPCAAGAGRARAAAHHAHPARARRSGGSLNLRGRIVTAIDLRTRLRLPPLPEGQHGMSVVVDYGGELYSVMVDAVGEVLSLSDETAERNPATLDPVWREVSGGIYRLDKSLLIVLDVARVLDFSARAEAARAGVAAPGVTRHEVLSHCR